MKICKFTINTEIGLFLGINFRDMYIFFYFAMLNGGVQHIRSFTFVNVLALKRAMYVVMYALYLVLDCVVRRCLESLSCILSRCLYCFL